MSQYSHNLKTRAYSLVGTQPCAFERIIVSNSVDLPDSVLEDEHNRVAYKSQSSAKRSRLTLSLPWALLLIMLTVGIISQITFGKIQQGKALKAEFTQMQKLYTDSEKERFLLADQLISAKDSNFICYYASQRLGMKLALHEETIQVVVPQSENFQQFAGFYGSTTSNNH